MQEDHHRVWPGTGREEYVDRLGWRFAITDLDGWFRPRQSNEGLKIDGISGFDGTYDRKHRERCGES
jgi:hypothetical protein